MKYLQERTTFLKSDNLKKGNILAQKIIEYIIKNHIDNKFFDGNNYRESPNLIINDRIYHFHFEGGMFISDDYFLYIYNIKDVADITYPEYYKNKILSKYEISKTMYDNFFKAGRLEPLKIDKIKLKPIEIPEKFMSDEKFMNDLQELSEETIAAYKYNL